jgi:Kef-type K+ transport system membrane component KefB
VEVEHILRDFGLILGAGLLSQLAATLLRLPEMIVLVAVGALIGPSVLGIASNPWAERVLSLSSRWACR